MTTAKLLHAPNPDLADIDPADAYSTDTDHNARVSFRQPVSPSGYIDAAWWPRSRDLRTELPALLDVLWTADREITHVTYNVTAWDPAPRRFTTQGRKVRLGGFTVGDPSTVSLTDSWGRERIDIMVIAPTTDPNTAQRALLLASVAASPYNAAELLAGAQHGATDDLDNHR